jgi:hypothetical protein
MQASDFEQIVPGETALDLARKHGHAEAARLLSA